MANEKDLVKQQLQQQEELANSPALAQRPPTTITMTPTTSSSNLKSGFVFSAPSGSYPFSGLQSGAASKGKLILPTALWVLLIMAGICFLFLLGSLTKSMRTLDTLVELEIEQAQRDAVHLDNLEQTLSDATRANMFNRNMITHSDDEENLVGKKAIGNSWFSPLSASNLLPLGWTSSESARNHHAISQDNQHEPQVISSSSVEYIVPFGSNQMVDSPSSMIKSVIDSFLQDSSVTQRDKESAKPAKAAKQAQSEANDSDVPKITANIDKIDVHINTFTNGEQTNEDEKFLKSLNNNKKQNQKHEQSVLMDAIQQQEDDLNNLLSVIMQPEDTTTMSQHHNSLINTKTRPFAKLASNDQNELLNSILDMIERDAVENFKKDNNKQPQSLHHLFADEKSKVATMKPETISSTPIHVITNFGAPNTNWHLSDLGAFGSPVLPASKFNGLPEKTKMDAELENLANDLMLTLGKFSPPDSANIVKSTSASKTNDDNFGDNIILFSSNEPSIGKHQKSQFLSLDEKPSTINSKTSQHKQTDLMPDIDNEMSQLFQMFFGPQPSPDTFKLSSKHSSPWSPASSSSKNNKPLASMDDFIPTIEIKSSSSSNNGLSPLAIKNIGEKEQTRAPTTTLPPSSVQKSPTSGLTSKAAPLTTTVEPSLDVFVDAVLNEILPTAAQTSGDRTGARVEDKKILMNLIETVPETEPASAEDAQPDKDEEISIVLDIPLAPKSV